MRDKPPMRVVGDGNRSALASLFGSEAKDAVTNATCEIVRLRQDSKARPAGGAGNHMTDRVHQIDAQRRSHARLNERAVDVGEAELRLDDANAPTVVAHRARQLDHRLARRLVLCGVGVTDASLPRHLPPLLVTLDKVRRG